MGDEATWDPRARRGRRQFLLLMLGLAVVAALAGLGLGALDVVDTDTAVWDGDPPGPVGILGVVVSFVGLAIMVGSIWYVVRTGRYRRNARSHLWAHSWSRRRELVRQVRGTQPVRHEDLPLLRQVARHLVDQPVMVLPLVGLAVVHVGQALLQWAPYFVVTAVILVVAVVAATVSVRRDARRARTFLAEHG